MKKKQQTSNIEADLRKLAEDTLSSVDKHGAIKLSDAQTLALVHELQVHQVELSAQNEELRRAQSEMEVLAAKYRDLYDYAPVSYLTLDSRGTILEANVASASLLGVGRRELIHKQFPAFLEPGSLEAYKSLCSLSQETGIRQSYEIELHRSDGTSVHVQAAVISVNTDGDGTNQLRVALWDITDRKRAEQTVQEHFEVLARKLGFLAGELDLDRFLKQSLVELTEQHYAECAAFWFADITQETITLHSINDGCHVLAGSQSGHPFASVPVPLQSLSFWTEMRRSRRPLILHEFSSCPQLPMMHERADKTRDRTLLLVPLLLGQNVLGLLVLQSLDKRTYLPEEIAFAQAVAQQVTIAVQMARLGEQARQTAVLQERNRMAQEIHDTLAQGFTVVLMQLEVVEDALTDSPEEAQSHLARARELARASLAEARRSVRALRPRELERDGLPGALAEVLTRTHNDTGIRPILDVQGAAHPLHEDAETNLLRIVQEALYNIQKHAEAARIWIELSFEPNSVRLAVRDDGKGFDSTATRDNNHFGLQVMLERTEAIGGVFELTTRPGHGTQIMVTVPTRVPGSREV